MGTMAENVIGMAGQAVQSQSHTAGDALQAFHITATADHARQELEMQKQDQDLNKAKWFNSQLDGLNRMADGPMKDAAIKSTTTQMQSLYPGMNLDLPAALHKDPELQQKLGAIASDFANGKDIYNPSGLGQFLSQSTPDLVAALDKHAQNKAMIAAAQFKSQGTEMRANAMMDNSTQTAGDKFDKDPNIQKLMPMGQSLGRDLKTLSTNSKDHPVTYQTLHESLMNVASVLGAGSLSDSRVNSITPHVSDEISKKVEQFFSDDPNQAADPKYISYVNNLVNRLHGAVKADVGDRADQIVAGRDPDLFKNPGIAQITQRKHAYYKSGQWMQNQELASQAAGGNPPQAQGQSPAAGASQPQFRQDVMDYAKQHNISPQQADQIRIQRGG